MKIERLRFDGIPAFVGLWEKLAKEYNLPVDQKRRNYFAEALLQEYTNPERIFLVLKNEGDEIVGMACGFLEYDIFLDKPVGIGEHLYLEPKYRKQKWGTRLIFLMEEWAKAKGAACFRVVCPDEKTLARWRKQGFTKVHYTLMEKEAK